MEFDATTAKILLAIISAFGTFAAVFLSTWQANRFGDALLEISMLARMSHLQPLVFCIFHSLRQYK